MPSYACLIAWRFISRKNITELPKQVVWFDCKCKNVNSLICLVKPMTILQFCLSFLENSLSACFADDPDMITCFILLEREGGRQ